jgi:hypothetical protein
VCPPSAADGQLQPVIVLEGLLRSGRPSPAIDWMNFHPLNPIGALIDVSAKMLRHLFSHFRPREDVHHSVPCRKHLNGTTR